MFTSGFDKSDQKELEDKYLEIEDPEARYVELGEIIDIPSIQSLMNDFYKLVHIPIRLNDLKGNVLIGVGWQDICTKFHWVHPKASKHCVESNTKLSKDLAPGEFSLYKCRNNLWDIVTPIMIGSQRVGYIFAGQFFFDDEPLDYELFRKQARKYGFNEDEYVAALEKVPRLSKESVETGISFFRAFANMLSQLSYSNNKLAKSLSVRDNLVAALRLSESKYRHIIETAQEGIWLLDSNNRTIFVNLRVSEILGYSSNELLGQLPQIFLAPEYREVVDERLIEHRQRANKAIDYRFIRKDGSDLWCILSTSPLFDDEGKYAGSLSMLTDITERKKTEQALKESRDSLDEKVKERTKELEIAYNSLKESEERLAEAQKTAHIGNVDWNLETGEVYWSDELYRIFRRDPQEPGATYDEFLNFIQPDDRSRVHNTIQKALQGEPVSGDYSIILANGDERKILSHLEVVFNKKNIPIRLKGTFQDITEIRKSEEKIRNLANIVESSDEAIITMSLDGTVTSWNKGAEQVYGYSPQEILGKPISLLAPSYLDNETAKLIERIMQGENVNNFETIRLRKDCKFIHVSITLSPVHDFHGKITSISTISRDITEKKISEEKLRESEEKYRNIVETANEGIVIINEEFRAIFINKKMADMVGYSLEECLNRPIWDFISEDSIEIVKNNFNEGSQGRNGNYEFKLRHKDGSLLWVFSTAKSLFDTDSRFIGSLSMLTDITHKKEAEEELNNIEIARKKEIHHRIKNNLQVISSLLDLQADKFRNRKNINDSEVLAAFRESQDRVISMALIHEELYRGGGLERLNFSPYVEELSDTLLKTYSLGNKNIALKLDLDINVFFDMDVAIPLGMIINELVSNSFKHAFRDRDKGEVQIKLHREEIKPYFKSVNENRISNTFSLTISDNGVGLPSNLDIEALDSLGLQLVTSLVAQIDGELEIKRNNGTEFTIKFTMAGKNNQIAATAALSSIKSSADGHIF